MKLLCIHAHFDDYEFVAAGTFELIRQKHAEPVDIKLVVCTDGAAGHHERDWDETRRMRWEEQKRSAAIGKYEAERLKLPSGEFRPEANPVVDRPFLASLWRTIRSFEPDYLVCPPLPSNPLAGVHVDHLAVAEAVRQVAYMINVPHAFIDLFPELNGPAVPCRTPVILNSYDAYMAGANPCDFVVDTEPVFEPVSEMTWCHQSQICEWLPWVGRHEMPAAQSFQEWQQVLRDRYRRQNQDLGHGGDNATEAFLVTAWGRVPTRAELLNDFPTLVEARSPMENLRKLGGLPHSSD